MLRYKVKSANSPEAGPFSERGIHDRIRSGALDENALISDNGSEWAPLHEFPAFGATLTNAMRNSETTSIATAPTITFPLEQSPMPQASGCPRCGQKLKPIAGAAGWVITALIALMAFTPASMRLISIFVVGGAVSIFLIVRAPSCGACGTLRVRELSSRERKVHFVKKAVLVMFFLLLLYCAYACVTALAALNAKE